MKSLNELQPLSLDIFKKKYMINGEETIKEVFKGIAKEISSNEKDNKKWEKIFYEEISSGRLIPAGRILANARPNPKVHNYNNCFTIEVEDSIEGIYNALKETALISKQGGGVGFNASHIRPRDSYISKGGVASGVMSFLEVFNTSAKIIQTAGSRRSALISVLNIDHPDIEEFITYKNGDVNKKLTQFNISVGVTKAFLEAVKNNENWDLVFKDKVYKTVKAKYLFNLLCENGFTHNEPGLLFFDEINKYNNGFYDFDIEACNPCFTKDTIVAVADGRNGVSIKQLAEEGKEFPVYSARVTKKGYWKAEIKKAIAFKTGNKKTIKVKLSDGSTFECTPEHLLALDNGTYIEAQNSVGKKLAKFYSFSNKMTNKSYRHINSKTNGYAKQYRMIWEFLNGEYDGKLFNIDHIDDDSTNDYDSNLQLLSIEEHNLKTMEKRKGKNNPIHKMNRERLLLSLRHKNVLGNGKRYNWTNEKIEEELSKLPELPEIEDSNVYLDEDLYVEEIIILSDTSDVYDLTVEDNHNFYIITKTDDENYLNSSGILVHNCAELVLPNNFCCCLSSIDFSKFVINPFTEDALIDYMELYKTIQIGVRFLDNVLDVTEYPLDKIKDNSLNYRRIGLGFTGYADMLAMLCMRYGSHVSKELTEELGSFFRNSSYKTSIELAIEKGKFPRYDKQLIESPFIQNLPEETIKEIKECGLRNIGLNTIAPTGTTSLSIGNNCSSGIEPMFSLEYNRTVRTGVQDKTYSEKVFDNAYLLYKKLFPDNSIPDYFVTTLDIDPIESIEIQSIWQKYIDASISKTCNLKPGTTLKTYKELIMYAFEKNLKGFTTFNPEGSMKGVLEYNKSTKDKRVTIERPNELDCDIHEVKVKGVSYIILVSKIEGQLFEVFSTINRDHKISLKRHKTGKIIKVKKGRYDLVVENGEAKTIIENIGEVFDDSHNVLSRFVSMSLRHNVPLQFIISQLNKSLEFSGFSKSMSRILKKYIVDGEKLITSDNLCPECGSHLEFRDGCITCMNCGFGRCG